MKNAEEVGEGKTGFAEQSRWEQVVAQWKSFEEAPTRRKQVDTVHTVR